ncbi:tryptophan--tRNA ligase [Geomicrobium sp. JCM 19039]|uniref:tryptophan--tRNA ligase n=1 Tax=Geomicrobium sp. JCM 19039 TaxID=1460636 RepID=UPI00045F422C|nr:tryptophan--tRNA ligase [Geomicrobium sp. JCM 19039]GAK10776.1 tryptophanyl-tRNA synthetase [Geomicrobium sp. JCM 19039]
MKKTVLTGIKPTGDVHVGNYIGSIKPSLLLAQEQAYQPVYFIADYHALTTPRTHADSKTLSYGVAATWLALGLEPEKVIFYKQSDVPEIYELSWILSCVTHKGFMNRAHAYKAITDKNRLNGSEQDLNVNMGLFNYPILMAADVLSFQSEIVPVGKDQIQHIEIARDIAQSFNSTYGDTFKLPNYKIDEDTATLPGLDGRKMSKSYHNTIPLFAEPKVLQKLINKIKTDSSTPDAPKDPNASVLFTLYKEFGTPEQINELREQFIRGISWGQVKNELFTVMNTALTEPRGKYQQFMASPKTIDQILEEGAQKARAITGPILRDVKDKIGL